jgi:hypothetical protein
MLAWGQSVLNPRAYYTGRILQQSKSNSGEQEMRKLLVCLLAFAVVFSISTLAQDTSAGMGKSEKTEASAPLKSLKGTIKADGDKYTFVNDKDQKSWEVMNPETLKGHEGHHVELKAHVYADKNQIHVMEVKMLKEKSM